MIIFSDMCVAQVFSDDYLSNHVVNRGDYQLQTDSTSSSFAQEFINESDTPVTSTATLETTVSETVTVTDSSGTQKSSTHNVGGSATLRIGNDSSFFGGSVTASYGYSWGQVIVQSKETAKADTMTTSASASMSVGDQAKLLASPLPTGNTDTYRYQSSNPGVAVVGDDGTITAKQTGETTVTVTSNSNPGLFARCVVTVVNPPSALKLSSNDLLLPAGGTGWLTASVSPAGTPAAISFTSSDETVAAVSDIGLVTAVSCGTAVIRAETGNGCYDLCYVKVVPPASGIDAPDELLLGVGETFALGEETALRRNALSEITYRSMDPEIVTVDASGFVIAVQRGETAIVIQGVGNVLKTVPVTVKPAPDRISISPAATTVSAADQFTVTAELPEGSVGTYRFSSSDERVARVSEDGLVTALGRGTAAITVTAYNGVSAACLIENLGVTEQSNALRLPASAMTVEPDAFAGTQARIVFVPDGAEVQKDAFAGCGQLLIVVTGGATRFADSAFDHEVLIVDSLE